MKKIKLIVFSDSHGDSRTMSSVLKKHPDVETVLHLGDGVQEFEELRLEFPDKKYYSVSGNCDWSSNIPTVKTFEINDLKFFLTHGHEYNVKLNVERLMAHAKKEQADVVLYGHTHVGRIEKLEGVLLINPGSIGRAVSRRGSYVLMDIVEQEVKAKIVIFEEN